MRFLILSTLLAWLGSAGFAESRALTVGWNTYPPFEMTTERGATGFDLEVAREALKRAGWDTSFLELPWPRQLAMAQSGALDIVPDATVTDDRKLWAVWTQTYRFERVALLAVAPVVHRLEVPLYKLVGTTTLIGIVRGSEWSGEFDDSFKHPGFSALIEDNNDDHIALLQKLVNHRLTYMIDDPSVAMWFGRQQKIVLEIARDLGSNPVSFLISRKTSAEFPQLLDLFNKALVGMVRDGTMLKLEARFGIVR